jgi:hypothetical protein
LPFSQATFERVSKSFYIHGSISPVISRADVPLFSCDEVFMKDNSNMDRKSWGSLPSSSQSVASS